MIIQAVELVSLPVAADYQEKFYRAHCDTGAVLDLFQEYWDVHLPPESLIGLTVDEARLLRKRRMIDTAQRHQHGHWRGA